MKSSDLDTGSFTLRTWIGGTDTAIEDVWVWPDDLPLGGRKCSTINDEKGSNMRDRK